MKPKIWPSIMAKNQQELNQDFKKLEKVTKYLHLDIVDGKFAPNKVLLFPFRLNKKFSYSAHLMIKNPQKWILKHLHQIELFIPHFEEIGAMENYLAFCKKNKKKIAFALKPETKIKEIKPYLDQIDYLLILTVHPGFYSAKYLPKNLVKVKQAKKINPKIKIIIDGGMHPRTIKKAAEAGADYFVSGSYTTKAEEPKKSIKNLMQALQ